MAYRSGSQRMAAIVTTYTAGKFSIEVSQAHPVWCQLIYDGHSLERNIRHDELADLQHVLSRAIAEAKRNLKQYASEVE